MAAEVLSDLSPALGTTFAPMLIRAWNRSSEYLSRLTVVPGGGQGGGKQVAWDVQFSGATAASFAEGSDVAGGELTHDTEKPATLAWGQYRSAFQLSNLELNAAYNNIGNPTELERILEERFFDAICAITSKVNKDLITGPITGLDGSSNPVIVGVIAALASTGSYAGINKGTFTEWAGNQSANGAVLRPLTLDLLAKVEQTQFTASGVSAEMLLTSAGIKTKYEGLFNAVQRMVAGSNGVISRMDASSEDLFWRGRAVVRDKDMTAGNVLGLRSSGIELRVLPWAPMPEYVPSTVHELVSSNGDMVKNLGSFLNVYPLARTGSAVKFCVEIYCQQRIRRTNEHFLLQDISEV